MAGPISNGAGGGGNPMGAVGSLLSGAGGGMAGAGGGDAVLQGVAMRIREIGQSLQALQAENPVLAADVEQINQLLKQMLVKAAQAGSMQTASGMGVPGAGGGV